MSRFARTLVLAGFASVLACSDSVAPEDIAGTWDASTFVFTSVANPGTSLDLIDAGYSASLTFNANGTYSISFTEPGGVPDTDNGTYTIDGDTFTLDAGTSDEVSGTISLSGDTMTIRITTGLQFDFGGGTEEAATAVIVLTRG